MWELGLMRSVRGTWARPFRSALHLTLVLTLLGACAASTRSASRDATRSTPERAAGRPPVPRLDDDGSGRDPLDERLPERIRVRAPLPPIADPGRLPAETGLPSPSDEGRTLYVVGGRPITEAALADFILRYFPDRARDPLGQLVDEALVGLEAERHGVDVAPALVRARANEHIEARRKKVRIEFGADASLEEMLASSFGRSIAEFERDARRLARVALLRDRLVRLDQIRVDRVEVRALTFPDKATADDAVTRLQTGADLTLLARRLGLRPPAAPPPFARDEIHPRERSAQLFAASAGDVLAPRAFTASDGKRWFEVIKVVARTQGQTESWSELREQVVAGLTAKPVGVPEYLAWRKRAIQRANVEVRRAGQGLVPWLPAPADSAVPPAEGAGPRTSTPATDDAGSPRGEDEE